MEFSAAFEGNIPIFAGDETGNLHVQFESAKFVIMVGDENSVAVEISFSIKVIADQPAPIFTGKQTYIFLSRSLKTNCPLHLQVKKRVSLYLY